MDSEDDESEEEQERGKDLLRIKSKSDIERLKRSEFFDDI